jgi:hypothetical protein
LLPNCSAFFRRPLVGESIHPFSSDTGLHRPLETWYRDTVFNNLSIIAEAMAETLPVEPGSMEAQREMSCEAGRIDLFIRYVTRGQQWRNMWDYAIVEFKRDIADESAIAQVLRYCGCLRTHLDRWVSAIVCAPGFTKGAVWAASVAEVLLVEMRVNIVLSTSTPYAPNRGAVPTAEVAVSCAEKILSDTHENGEAP